ncbi:carbamoyltransferase [Roseivirga sp.]|uniref:carbamoyltransferase family protein n=1 Tax=Roseivirga sp. TaxID=1964215 RepID=UPI003B52CBA1
MKKDIYILGTGLSHNGSTVLLKNGHVLVGIEKERLSRIKHDGGNDTLTVNYCLETAGISLKEVDLVVQCENFVIPSKNRFKGPRVFEDFPEDRFISISHHLAHAYSAIGTCPFEEFNVLVIDGCGSPYDQCTEPTLPSLESLALSLNEGLICEKDSFYHYDGKKLHTVFKDFSPFNTRKSGWLPTTNHSIGGFYSAISHYCFGNMDDVGKLMGLAPFGKRAIEHEAFELKEGRVFLKSDWDKPLIQEANDWEGFKANRQHYADMAFWAQRQVEKALLYVFQSRLKNKDVLPLAYSGGVALNAVANSLILRSGLIDKLYIEPAAADNGLALGCAYYGWLEILQGKRQAHNGNTCFGKSYTFDLNNQFKNELQSCSVKEMDEEELVATTARLIKENKTVGWFQGGCEFGPRALGRRSILANPGNKDMQDHINANIKFREDFRPFAPAILINELSRLFLDQFDSPYMILIDRPQEDAYEQLAATIHADGTSRTQTVDAGWNPRFYRLLEAIKAETGTGAVLNTSFNRKGQPMVEQPYEAIELFLNSALDVLVIENHLICK